MSGIAINSSKNAAFSFEKRAPLIMYAAILIFFIALYWLMTMTGEDISQFTTYNQCSTIDTIKATYQYLPRIGEFYHNLIIRCYEPVARMNLRFVPRLIDACFSAMLLYSLAWLAFSRRPRIDMRSSIAAGGIFSVMILTRANAIFMSRFSVVHNYVLGFLILIFFCIPYACYRPEKSRRDSMGAVIGLFLLGMLTGYSSEVSPSILFALMTGFVVIMIRSGIRVPRWMPSGLSGLLTGIMLFYTGGGLTSRSHGNYGIAFEYVFSPHYHGASLSSLIRLLLDHLLFNGRYVWPALLFLLLCYVRHLLIIRANAKKCDNSRLHQQKGLILILLIYSILYLASSSVIRVEDELYGRYMAGVYICAAIAAAQIADAAIFHMLKINSSRPIVLLSALTIFVAIVNLDMLHGFTRYNLKCQNVMRQLQQNGALSINESELAMRGSPLFHLHQYPLFESWANDYAFGVSLLYKEDNAAE